MTAAAPSTPQRLLVDTPAGLAGVLVRDDAGYVFVCDAHAPPAAAVSLAMPVRATPYVRAELHPIFQMNLPEGYLAERLRLLLAKASGTDPLLLLALLGQQAPIGRLRYSTTAQPQPQTTAGGEQLTELLAHPGAQALFDALVGRYLTRSAASGVQPKVLVPMAGEPPKATVLTPEWIVKSGLGEFPGLAINEYLCLSAARRAGMPVPECHLSHDGQLFVMARFDRHTDGRALGFEDMAVLSGKGTAHKYNGRYEDMARLIAAYCSPEQVPTALARLFDLVALSCIVGNGDAHLKNAGLLYDTPEPGGAVWLAPTYDIVCTTCYLPDDTLALTLGGNKSFYAARLHLLEFGTRHCRLTATRLRERLQALCDAVDTTLTEQADLAAAVPGLTAELQRGMAHFDPKGFHL